MKNILFVAFMAAALSGCDYTSGTKVTSDQAQQFTVGVSTLPEVEAKLGQPTETTTNSDGTQTAVYQFNDTHWGAMNYVPLVGSLHSHVDQTSNKTIFIFSQTGLLQSYSIGSGSNGLSN